MEAAGEFKFRILCKSSHPQADAFDLFKRAFVEFIYCVLEISAVN